MSVTTTLSPECTATLPGLANVEKVVMILSRNSASSFLLGAVITASAAVPPAMTGDFVDGSPIVHAASRCAEYGPGFVDMGNGTCSRIAGHVRVELGTRNASSSTWTAGGTSSAALRSDGLGMLPGAGDSRHLRVRSGLESFSPFQ